MIKYPIIALLIFHFSLKAYGQLYSISGKIVNSETKEPVSYAAIGIMGSPFGTVSDKEGNFKFSLNRKLDVADTMIISSVGYKRLKIIYNDGLTGYQTYTLEPDIMELKTVEINSEKLKSRTVGKGRKGGLTHVNIISIKDTVDDGLSREFGVILNLNQKVTLINEFGFFVSSNNFDYAKLRLLIYVLSPEGIPTNNILNNNIFIEVEDQKTGWAIYDLSPYNIIIENYDKVAITLQWIEYKIKNPREAYFAIPASISPWNGFVYRNKNQDIWVVNNSLNPSIFIQIYQ